MIDMLNTELGDLVLWQYIVIMAVGLILIWWKGQ
jgi:hypothetical protein